METLNKLPQQLQVISPSHSSVMQIGGLSMSATICWRISTDCLVLYLGSFRILIIGGCNICDGGHEPGQCIAQEDSSREVNYMGT